MQKLGFLFLLILAFTAFHTSVAEDERVIIENEYIYRIWTTPQGFRVRVTQNNSNNGCTGDNPTGLWYVNFDSGNNDGKQAMYSSLLVAYLAHKPVNLYSYLNATCTEIGLEIWRADVK